MKKKYTKWILSITVLLIILILSLIFSLCTGEFAMKLTDIPSILHSGKGMEYLILTNIRLPRILLAFSVGGVLSMTGAILQGIYRNPLVEPYTLGISGGAALGVSVSIVLGLHQTIGALILPFSGFIGALSTIFLVYFLSIKKGVLSVNKMLLIGVMISFIASSSMMFLMSISNAEDVHSIIFWTMGSLDESNSTLINLMFYSSLIGLLVTYLFANQLNVLRLGEAKARHLGVNSTISIRILFVIFSLLTGLCVSIVGIIGFVGLIIPHIAKMIVGSDYRIMLITSFLGGSIFILLSDIVARTIIAPNELPIGVITGMIGGLVFITILNKNAKTLK